MNVDFASKNYININSDLAELHKVENFIDEFCRSNNFNEDHFGNIIIAVTEAVNNAIVHGNNNTPSKSIKVGTELENAVLKFSIEDEGNGFDYDNLPDPTAPENLEKEHGRGVFLMRSLADDVEFENKGSKVVLTFNSNG